MSREERLFRSLGLHQISPSDSSSRRAPSWFERGARVVLPALRVIALAVLSAAIMTAAEGATAPPPGAYPCLTGAIPAGYGSFVLLKSATFQQASAAAPTESSAVATIALQPPTAYGISNAIVSGPKGFQAALARQPEGTSTWAEDGTEAGLAVRMPAGAWSASYRLDFPGGDSFFGILPFTLVSNAPPVPAVANYDAAQRIQPAAAFAIEWQPWLATGSNDRISLQIVDSAGRKVLSAASDCSGDVALGVNASGFTIPAGKLAPTSSYTGYLTFGANTLAAQDEPSQIVERGYQSRTTRFSLKTGSGGGTVPPAELTVPSISGTNLVFLIKGTPGSTHAIEGSADFVTWQKETEVTLPASGEALVTLPLPADGRARFYRSQAIGGGGGTPGAPASLTITLVSPNEIHIGVTGTPGAAYRIESSPDFQAWSSVPNGDLIIPAGTNRVVFSVGIDVSRSFLGFRAVATAGGGAPADRPPSLAMELGTLPNSIVLKVLGGDPNRRYRLQTPGAKWNFWLNTATTVTTDSSGNGTVPIPFFGRFPGSQYYRVKAE